MNIQRQTSVISNFLYIEVFTQVPWTSIYPSFTVFRKKNFVGGGGAGVFLSKINKISFHVFHRHIVIYFDEMFTKFKRQDPPYIIYMFQPIQAGWENPARVLLIECRSYSNQPPTAGKPQPKTSPPQQKTPPPPPPPPRYNLI